MVGMMTMELSFPIKFYKQKQIMIFLIMLCAILFVFLFLEVFFDYFLISHHRELPYFIKVILMLVMGGWLFVLIKMVFSNLPHIILEKDSIALLNPFKNTYDTFYFKDIENIEFGFGKSAMMGVYLKNQPPLSNANKVYPLTYYHISGQKPHSRQVADVISQVFDNYNNHHQNPIMLREAKKGFLDWD